MKLELTIKSEHDIKKLRVSATVSNWECAEVNGVLDQTGTMMPCRLQDAWEPTIDVETGQILNWTKGVTADICYKVCDDGIYTLIDGNGRTIVEKEGYVPDCLCPSEPGHGDYIIMKIDRNGFIKGWVAEFDDFGSN